MGLFLRQSTAATFRIGPFLDDTDGKTAETSLTLTQPDFRLSKAGGAFAQKNDATSGSHDENGYYTCVLNATDTNTLGQLRIHVAEAGALPVWVEAMVMPVNVWDSLFGADSLQVHAVEIANDLITAAAIAADAIGSSELAASAVTEIQTGLATDTVALAIKAKTDNLPSDPADESLIIAATDAIMARLGAPAGASIAADIAAVTAPTGNENADALLDRVDGVETGFTVRQVLRLIGAVLGGKASGLDSNTVVFRDLGDTKNRIVSTVDGEGNRTDISRDLT